MANSVSVSAPASGAVSTPMAVSGTVSPAADIVSLQLSQQNTTLPTGAWNQGATGANGAFSGILVPPAAGTWYAWAWDQLTGVYAVSGPIAVPSPVLASTNAAPLSVDQAASLLDSPAAGLTVDQLTAAAPSSDTDTVLIGQGTKVIFAQPLSAIWTWLVGKMTAYLLPQVNVSVDTSLTNSAHNGRILVVGVTGITIQPLLPSLGTGFSCDVLNLSSGTVTLSGMTTSTGATTIAAGAAARIFAITPAGGSLTLFAKL